MEEKVAEAERKGHKVGWAKFLASNKYKELVAKHWLEGAFDFKKSSTYESNVIEKAVDFMIQGFELCVAQANHLKAFQPNVDLSKRSYFVDASLNLQPKNLRSSLHLCPWLMKSLIPY